MANSSKYLIVRMSKGLRINIKCQRHIFEYFSVAFKSESDKTFYDCSCNNIMGEEEKFTYEWSGQKVINKKIDKNRKIMQKVLAFFNEMIYTK